MTQTVWRRHLPSIRIQRKTSEWNSDRNSSDDGFCLLELPIGGSVVAICWLSVGSVAAERRTSPLTAASLFFTPHPNELRIQLIMHHFYR